MLPHVEFESPELKSRFDDFITTLDKDMDSSGFDTSSETDERFEALEECWEDIENDIVVEIRSATDEEQEQLDTLAEEIDKDEAEEDADVTAGANREAEEATGEEAEEAGTNEAEEAIEVTEIIVELEEEANEAVDKEENGNGADDSEEMFEQELEDEIAEQSKMAELAETERKLKGENATGSA